jgi:predicted metal-binding protein
VKERVRSNWRTAILICRKCEKKLGGGFGPDGDQRLSKLLRRQAGGKGRKAAFGVVEVGCLKVCPEGAVTVVNAARPGEWLLIRRGTAVEEVEWSIGLSEEVS